MTHGFEYTEHPHCPTPGFGHDDGIHIECEYDSDLKKHVFRFDIHITPFLDRDRCKTSLDRQRNEMKSRSENSTWAKVQGNYDEWQRLEWKFKLSADFKPSAQFCHIHQLKAHDGKFNASPLITITPRSNADGSNQRMQIIHRAENGGKTQGILVDDIPLSLFLDEWIEVQAEMHYSHEGYYRCKMIRVRDGKILVDYSNDNIDLWRSGSTFIRSKFGLYRSLGGDVPLGKLPKNGIKNESIWLADFKVFEKNTNPSPTIPHN
ncbi:MAG: polysaccharide lyase [Odoribacter sp.]|nr:polysaccharide lyase [Odoribacter sp.]